MSYMLVIMIAINICENINISNVIEMRYKVFEMGTLSSCPTSCYQKINPHLDFSLSVM